MKRLFVFLFLLLSTLSLAYGQSSNPTLFPLSPLRTPIPSNATYIAETRIGTFRNTFTDYSGSYGGCRVPVGTTLPLVRVTVTSSGRVENWQIPTTCRPDTGSDHHLNAANYNTGFLYECWDCTWNSSNTAISAGGAVDYAISGSGITSNPNHRTTAAGFSEAMGQIRLEDMLACDTALPHGLTIALPRWAISTGFISPAVGGEERGTGGSSAIPMGTRFALPRSLNVDSLPNIQPFTRTVLRAAQTYGLLVADGNSSGNYLSRPNGADYAATATFRVEPNTLESVCGVDNDSVLTTVGSEIGNVIATYGLYRVTFNSIGTVTPVIVSPTATRTPTRTPTIVSTSITVTPSRTPTGVFTPFSFTCIVTTPNPFTAICH